MRFIPKRGHIYTPPEDLIFTRKLGPIQWAYNESMKAAPVDVHVKCAEDDVHYCHDLFMILLGRRTKVIRAALQFINDSPWDNPEFVLDYLHLSMRNRNLDELHHEWDAIWDSIYSKFKVQR